MRRLIWVVLALVSCTAVADARDRVEASMLVSGWVEIAPDGGVYNYTLDQPEKLDTGVADLIAKTIAAWKFQPVLINDKPVLARAKMNLRVVASPIGHDQYNLRVRGATFGDGASSDRPAYERRRPPAYPIIALRAATGGTVYLALEIDRSGHVEQAIAQQVDLRAIGSELDMRMLRNALASSSVDAAKSWTFKIPATGHGANAQHWTVMVPVNFNLVGQRKERFGEWDSYVPGPVQPVPWEQDHIASHTNADAVPDGPAFFPDPHFVLLTPPSPG